MDLIVIIFRHFCWQYEWCDSSFYYL